MLRESIEKFIEYLPSPTSELALAAILVYTFLFSVERHGAASQSEGLTRWVQGADNRTWAHHYSLFLDHVFGGRSISWRCFIRSSIVSIVSVGLIYIVMYSAVDLSPDRVRDPFVFWKYIALAIFFNLIPDYLSLLETRWLIRQLDRITSVLGNVAALIVDVLCSAIIGALWIVLVSYLGGFSTSPIELVLVFSKLSVFFYSGFLASFFAIATWVTLSAMRLTSRTAIGKWLEMDRRPIEHRRLFFSGIVLVTGLLVGPLLVRDGETG